MLPYFYKSQIKIGPQTTIGTDDGSSFGFNLTDLPDGNFLASWIDNDQTGLQLQKIHKNGHIFGPQATVMPPEGLEFTDWYDIDVTSDGKVWIAASQSAFGVGSYRLNTTSFDIDDIDTGIVAAAENSWYRVDANPDGSQIAPSLSVDITGDAIVSWIDAIEDEDAFLGLSSAASVKMNVLSEPSLTKTGAVTVNNLTFATGLYNTQVTTLNNGTYVVLWDGLELGGSNSTIQFQRYQSNGIKIGGPVTVPNSNDIVPFDGRIATLADGGFVVAWQSGSGGTRLSDIRFNTYDNNGVLLNSRVAHDNLLGIQSNPTVVASADGFTVGWTDSSGFQDDPSAGSFARDFFESGNQASDTYLLNTSTIGDQTAPVLAVSGGNLAAIWDSTADSIGTPIYESQYQIFDQSPEVLLTGLPTGIDAPEPTRFVNEMELANGSRLLVTLVDTPNPFQQNIVVQRSDAAGTSQVQRTLENVSRDVTEIETVLSVAPDGYIYIVTSTNSGSGEFYIYDPNFDSVDEREITSFNFQGQRYVIGLTGTTFKLHQVFSSDEGVFALLFGAGRTLLQQLQSGQEPGTYDPIGDAIRVLDIVQNTSEIFFTNTGTPVISVPEDTFAIGDYIHIRTDQNNSAPVAVTTQLPTIESGRTLDVSGLFTDADGDALSYSVTHEDAAFWVDGDGVLRAPVGATEGSVSVTAHDRYGDTATISLGVTVSTLRVDGTDAAENVTGTNDSELISAGAGSDWITPGAGSDTIDGGDGRDMVSFVNLADTAGRTITEYRLVLDLQTGVATTSGADTYSLSSVERVTGTIYSDQMRGDDGNNELRGMGAYDWLIGTGGSDTLDGGTGRDMISYLEATSGVTVSLADQSLNTGLAAGDVYNSIERITGSGHIDVFYGDAGENDFRGLGGYDVFYGSTGGRERYDGGGGSDTVTYVNSTSGVVANLAQGFGTGGDAARDLYTSIENLGGSNFDDALRGTDDRNNLRGLSGDDFIFGGGGIDRISGGRGEDTIDGGAGSDYILYRGSSADFDITREAGTRNAIVSWTGSGAGDGTDTLTNVEYLVFDDRTIDIWSL